MTLQDYVNKTGLNIWQLDKLLEKERLYNWIKESKIIQLTGWGYYDDCKRLIKQLKAWYNEPFWIKNQEVIQYIQAIEEYLLTN